MPGGFLLSTDQSQSWIAFHVSASETNLPLGGLWGYYFHSIRLHSEVDRSLNGSGTVGESLSNFNSGGRGCRYADFLTP